MKGNLGRLLRLAGTPYPLPLAGLRSRRSLLDVEALGRAVIHMLTADEPVDGAYAVSDKEPVTVAEIVAAFRAGMGRPPGLFSLPPALLEGIASLAGQRQALQGIFAEEICDPSALEDTGWVATGSSIEGLAALGRQPTDGAVS
jgi:UDP-glucose 4-epimerase